MSKTGNERTAIYMSILADPARRRIFRMLTEERRHQDPKDAGLRPEVAESLEVLKAVDQSLVRKRQAVPGIMFESKEFLEQCLESALTISPNLRTWISHDD